MPGIDPLRLLIAIALSLVLWVVVRTEVNPEREGTTAFTVPVQVVDVPPGLEVTSDPPEVQVEIRATEDVWRRITRESFTATVDASRAVRGPNDALPVRVAKADADVAMRIVTAVPRTVAVRLEQIEEKIVPVRVDLAGGVPFGYTYAPPLVQPANVTVRGPASVVQRVVAALIDIRLDGVTVSLNTSNVPRPVDARSQDVRNVQVDPATVNVSVQVSQQVTYKQVGVRPVASGVPASGYFVPSLSVDPSSVTLVGNPSSLASIEFVETRAVNITGATNTVVQTTELAVPSGVSLLQQSPVTVTVRVTPIVVEQTLRVPVSITGLRGGLLLQSDLTDVDVTISGQAPTLQNLSPRDLQVQLDLSGLGPGKHIVRPNVIVPQAITVERYTPDQLTVTLAQPTPTPTPTATATAPPTATPTPTWTPEPTPTPDLGVSFDVSVTPTPATALAPSGF